MKHPIPPWSFQQQHEQLHLHLNEETRFFFFFFSFQTVVCVMICRKRGLCNGSRHGSSQTQFRQGEQVFGAKHVSQVEKRPCHTHAIVDPTQENLAHNVLRRTAHSAVAQVSARHLSSSVALSFHTHTHKQQTTNTHNKTVKLVFRLLCSLNRTTPIRRVMTQAELTF